MAFGIKSTEKKMQLPTGDASCVIAEDELFRGEIHTKKNS